MCRVHVLADINYSYNGKYLGSGSLIVDRHDETSFVFTDENAFMVIEEEKPIFIYINTIVKVIAIIAGILVIVLIIKRIVNSFHFARRRKYILRETRKRRKFK